MSQGESKLSRDIMARCRVRGAFAFKVHGGPTMMSGLPDIVTCYRGVFVTFETKMPEGGDASEVQRLRHRQIRMASGYATVVRSIAEAMSVYDEIDRQLDA
jgi:hypothetical protein